MQRKRQDVWCEKKLQDDLWRRENNRRLFEKSQLAWNSHFL